MTLRIHPGIQQGSEEWADVRRGIVTASVIGKLITSKTLKPADNDESRGLTALLAAERITGYTDDTYMNSDMWRGVMEEPRARDYYSEHHAEAREIGFMVLEETWGTLGYSPDGLVGEEGLIEVKAPRSKTHLRTVLSGQVPAHHMAQLQAGLLVSGREWCDFISWCGGLAPFIKRVYPDPRWQEAIVAAVTQFELNVEAMTADYKAITVGLPVTERIDSELGLVF
jgi:putative phage-type endonuclease